MPAKFFTILLLLTVLVLLTGCKRKADWDLVRCKGQSVEGCTPVATFPTLKECIAEARQKNFEYIQIGDIVKYGCAERN